VVLVGQKKALAMAVRGSRTVRRWSKLGDWLSAAPGGRAFRPGVPVEL
jgi:exodeoxyribonuclease V alpha subunit